MAVIKIDGYDIYTYTRVAPGEGLDVADTDFLEPQFTETASGFGDPLISVQYKNRELVVPVHLKGTSKDNLHSLVSDLNRRLSIARQLEWKDDGATNSSYLKIQFARFEPEFNKRRQDAGWMSGVIRIYTEPYAQSVPVGSYAWTSGSFAGTGISASNSIASGITGDAPITTRFDITAPSTFNPLSHGRILGVAILPASYVSDWAAASLVVIDGFLRGASGAAGSQVFAHNTLANTALPVPSSYIGRTIAKLLLTNASSYAGNNRVLAVVNSDWDVRLRLARPEGPMNTPVAATMCAIQGKGTVDLGVVNIDPVRGATYTLTFETVIPQHSRRGYTDSAASFAPPFELNRVILLPENSSMLLVDDSRRQVIASFEANSTASTVISVDTYGNTISASNAFQSVASQYLVHSSTAAQGGINGVNRASTARGEIIATAADVSGQAYTVSSATSQLGLGKHTQVGDWYVRADIVNASLAALSVIYSNASVTASVIASVGIANDFSNNDRAVMRLKQQGAAIGGEVQFYSSTQRDGSGVNTVKTASITASVAALAMPGTPLVSVYGGTFLTCAFTAIPSTGTAAGDLYSIDYDLKSAIRTNAIVQDAAYGMRGAQISFSPEPSKYTAAVVYHLPLDRSDDLNTAWSAKVSLNEHFTYSK